MCGFLGWIEPRGLTLGSERLDAARDILRHRGPDDARSRRDEVCHLGFRRLAIVDLSENGAQPMPNAAGSCWLVFNGEIYNHVELREELKAGGAVFRGHSDTEVVLALYDRHGGAMLSKLNGMFAFALYDRTRGRVLFARDRCGEKPLFLWPHVLGLGFASELSALRALPGFPTEFNARALGSYLRLGFVPEGGTLYPHVSQVPPGCTVAYELSTNTLGSPEPFWVLPHGGQSGADSEALTRIGTLLDDSVAIRLRADVPVGCFLSGGIDSSLVLESAVRQSARTIESLTVKFPGWSDDEEPLARKTALKLGLRPRIIPLDSLELNELPALCAHFDAPFADSSLLPTALVCRLARKHFTVVLSGDGGDEVFGGYDNHLRAVRYGWVEEVPRALRRFLSQILATGSMPDSRQRRFAWRFARPTGRWGLGAKLYPNEQWLEACVRPEFHLSPEVLCASLDHRLGPVADGALNEAQRTDLRLYLPDDVLVKVDRMSMLSSLEVRSPFLDHRLVETGLALTVGQRVSHGQGKRLLRALACQRGLPSGVCQGTKRGFGLPLHRWLFHSPAARGLRTEFLEGAGVERGIFFQGRLASLWTAAVSNPALTSAVFRVLALHWWLGGEKQRSTM